MSDFIENQADEEEGNLEEYSKDEIRKVKKLRQIASDSSDDEEEEDDEELIREENKGFINDEEEESAASESDDGGKRKRNEDYDEEDSDVDNLDDDDLDLIEENIGVKIDRKKKFKRLKRIEDEDSDEEAIAREQITSGLFAGSDAEDAESQPPRAPSRPGEEYVSEEEEEGSEDEDNFIVDDEGRPIQRSKKKAVFEDEGLEAARNIFGCDFDYEEFKDYDEAGIEEEDEDEDDDDEYEDEEDVDGIREPRRRMKEKRKKPHRKSIYEVFEPSELERGHLTDQDNEIRRLDIPERFLLRQVPVSRTRPKGVDEQAPDHELDMEARWIYHHTFYKPFISNQEGREEARRRTKRDSNTIQKIYNALDLIRNWLFEVPFIAFYRKEEVMPELSIHDLWKVHKWDEKWCQLKSRKESLSALLKNMKLYQDYRKECDSTYGENIRLLTDEDINRIEEVETSEQFNDIYRHFLLYYGKDQASMKEFLRAKAKQSKPKKTVVKTVKVIRKVRRKKKKKNLIDDDDEENGEDDEDEEEEEVETEVETEVEEEVEDEAEENDHETDDLKKAIRRHEYELLRRAGIEPLSFNFGLSSEQYGENVRDNYQRYEAEQISEGPVQLAEKYLSRMCPSTETVLSAAIRMVGWQICYDPLVRKTVRDMYFDRAKFSIQPTKKGIKIIDETHALYSLKYVKDKPVCDLKNDQFLRIKMGVEEKLIAFSLYDTMEGNTLTNYMDEMKQLYYRDEFSQVVQDWNELRSKAVEFGMISLINELKKELVQRLLQEAKDFVIDACCRKLYNWLKIAPYDPRSLFNNDDDDDREWSVEDGFRVFAVAYLPDISQAAFGAIVDVDGECQEFIKLPHVLRRRDAYNDYDAKAKEEELKRLKEFLLRRKPHVILVSGESREALGICNDITAAVKELEEDEDEYFPSIKVELVENDLSKVYAASKRAEQDYHDYPPLLRQAISLARRLQDPLIEFSQLCSADEEILSLRYHPLQDQINQGELLEALYSEFVNRTNEVGVDLNKAVAFSHIQNLVQFVCGLGPRKANALLKQMKSTKQRLENRNQLVTTFHMGEKVFLNCAGFIKIDTSCLGDSDNYIEVLDSTRIHPEAYDWARKMAVDALEYDDEEGKPPEALEEILESPEKLSELDLEAFATELNNQGFGKKNQTLYDIRHELNFRYKDFRIHYQAPTPEEIFNMLTKESPETFYCGKLIQTVVIHFIHRKPKGEQLDNANPVRNEDTGLWQCPFCLKNDFPELSEVWSHFDASDCPGQAIGIRVRLDNGIVGFISMKNLSDKVVNNPSERVKHNSLIHCRIIKIDPEKFSVDLTCRSSDLQDSDNKWKPPKDVYYDFEGEEKDNVVEHKKKERMKSQYHKRVIVHPAFRNVDYVKAEKLMQDLEQGDVIIRPSSKGVDHLTVTWKVADGVYQHVDVREQNKINDFSLGQKLWIGNEEFEDLDEIIARYISPMAANVRQILEYKYFKESLAGNKERAAEHLREEKKNSKNIPYVFHICKNLPGKFMLSYLPRNKVIHEYVTILPDGYRFRQKYLFPALAHLLKWFKANFRSLPAQIPTATPGMMSSRTPYGATTPSVVGLDASAIQKASLSGHFLHGVSAATTPYGTTPGGFSSYAPSPYTPSGQTPFLTPYGTPGPSATPRYGGQTPSQFVAFPMATGNRTPSQRVISTPARNEQLDWSKASESWASRISRNTSRSQELVARSTPIYSDSKFGSGNFASFEDKRGAHIDRRSYDFDQVRSTPRSVRSTPRTIHSPSNMSLGGDQTPLYDE